MSISIHDLAIISFFLIFFSLDQPYKQVNIDAESSIYMPSLAVLYIWSH